MRYLLISFLLFTANSSFSQSDTLKASQAKEYVGKEIIIKDVIAGVRLFERSDKTTFLINIAEKYPNTPLTVVLYDGTYLALPQKENLEGKSIIVKGEVTLFNEKVQIVITDLKNLKIF